MRLPTEVCDRHCDAIRSAIGALEAAAHDGANVRQYLAAALDDLTVISEHDKGHEITRLRLRIDRCLELQRQCELGARSVEGKRVLEAAWQRVD